jgi:ribosomal-protein-serine acetyltransferase
MTTITIDNDLVLRSYTEEDYIELFEVINKSRRHLAPWLGWVNKTTRPEHSLEFIRLSHDQLHNQQGVAMAMIYQGRIAGGLGMLEWNHDVKKAQVGYWIAKEHEGKGLVSRSLGVFLHYLFDHVGLNKIELHYSPANSRSAKVAERLGFRLEGILRQSFSRNGIIEDLVITGMLKSEWARNKN